MTIKGYHFYYRPVTDPESDWIRATGVPINAVEYSFSGLASNTEYEFASAAVDRSNNIGPMSEPVTVSTLGDNVTGDPMLKVDTDAIDAIVLANMGNARGCVLSISGPRGYYTKAYGSDYTAGKALTVDDKMHYGSTTKMNTALLICHQIDLGRISFDTTLDQFETIDKVTNSHKITIKHLLMNRSGVYECMNPAAAFGQQSYLNPTGVGHPIPAIINQPSQFEPGTKYEYCNSNWMLLGEILRQIDAEHGAGRTIAEIVNQDCYATLGLTGDSEWRSGPYMTPPYSRGWTDNPAYPMIVQTIQSLPLYGLLGWLYWMLAPGLTGGWPTTPTYEFTAYDPSWPDCAGCLDGNIAGLRRFGEALYNGSLLSPAMQQLRDETFTTYYPIGLAQNQDIGVSFVPTHDFEGTGWMGAGLGLMSWGSWIGWNGMAAGYGSALWYNKDNGTVIAIMQNYFHLAQWSATMKIAHYLYPDSLGNPDWKMRLKTGLAAPDAFATGALWNWHAPGDTYGATQLPHRVGYYL